MLRKTLWVFCVLILATSALAESDTEGTITVLVTIPPEIKIWFQEDSGQSPPSGGPVIGFSGDVGTDYYRATSDGLIGPYVPTTVTTGTAKDGWVSGYFESKDGAAIWLQSNMDLSGNLTTGGDLDDGFGNTLPTWFTIVVNGYEKTLHIPDPNGFRLGNSMSGTGWVHDGVIPGIGAGGYAGDGDQIGEDVAGPVIPICFGNQAFYPNQDAFRMSTASGSTFDMDSPIGPGRMKFQARCLRSGLHDVAGPYTTTITVTFTTGP